MQDCKWHPHDADVLFRGRTFEAEVFCSKCGTVFVGDPWDMKAVRAWEGAHLGLSRLVLLRLWNRVRSFFRKAA